MTTSDFTTLEPEHLIKSIKALAEEFDCPMEEVNKIYASALGSLRSSARIQDYLSVLTSKKVRDMLRQQDWSHSSQVSRVSHGSRSTNVT